MASAQQPITYLSILLSIAWIVSTPITVRAQKLRVGFPQESAAPFVMQDGTDVKGISVDIWDEMTQFQAMDYELIPQPSLQSGIDALARKKLDVVIGPISITADRLEKVEFTQPFFVAHIGVLVTQQAPSIWSRVRPFFRMAVLSSVAILCCCLFGVGNLIWLAERHHNPDHFPREYFRGVGNGMWFALVTLTTVGYGDRAPITRVGRLIAGIWMVITLLTVSSLTAGLASAFTLSLSGQSSQGLTDLDDLKGARMAVITGTTSVKWAQYYGAKLQQTPTLEGAIELVVSGQADGIVFDRPVLQYYLRQHPELDLMLAPFSVATEKYGFALSLNSSLRRDLDLALLKLEQDRRVQRIEEMWLKE